ncbi:MAG: FISUMP domain-containing protein [Bacteroidales bacterium]|jgi:uncharacterized protein (TIGR02145 family)|nr:FISUMP domain-containing protein [Bacteroidales bacterium]
MKKIRQLTGLLLIAGFLMAYITACEKTEVLLGALPSDGTIVDADGNVYNTVQIGNQVWTVENLKTTKYNNGNSIPNLVKPIDWAYATKGAYCNYNNLESNADIYGRLYNWHAVSTGKLAPSGWHVATDNDWLILESYVGANRYILDTTKLGTTIAKLLCAKTNWPYGYSNGAPGTYPQYNNGSGFSALPGGLRYSHGEFAEIERYGYWWTSTQTNSDYARHRYLLFCNSDLLRLPGHNKLCGFSVRLVKN